VRLRTDRTLTPASGSRPRRPDVWGARFRVRIQARLFKAQALGSRIWFSGFSFDLCQVSGREACKSRLENESPARLSDSQRGVEAHFAAGAVDHYLPLSTLWQLRNQHSLDPVGLWGSREFRVSGQWTSALQQWQSACFFLVCRNRR